MQQVPLASSIHDTLNQYVGAMLFHCMQRQPSTKTESGQRPVSAVQLPA